AWFARSFQNGVSRLHSTRGLQTMSSFVCFSICENYCTLSCPPHKTAKLKRGYNSCYLFGGNKKAIPNNLEIAFIMFTYIYW
ncbi:hypothetical protein, partial [Phascolarctobacterium faecium]|uniref:hypothetical protein n=1 Tax=Phascolarctobacterium faecium TaxID=33025 RepID=UPI003AB38699